MTVAGDYDEIQNCLGNDKFDLSSENFLMTIINSIGHDWYQKIQ